MRHHNHHAGRKWWFKAQQHGKLRTHGSCYSALDFGPELLDFTHIYKQADKCHPNAKWVQKFKFSKKKHIIPSDPFFFQETDFFFSLSCSSALLVLFFLEDISSYCLTGFSFLRSDHKRIFPQRSWSFRPFYLCLTQHVIKIPVAESFVKNRQVCTKMLTGSQIHKEKLNSCQIENAQYWIMLSKSWHLYNAWYLTTYWWHLWGGFVLLKKKIKRFMSLRTKALERLHETLPGWLSWAYHFLKFI